MNENKFHKKKIAVVIGSGALPELVIKGLRKLAIEFAIVKFKGINASFFCMEKVIEATFENISDLFIELKVQKFNSIICCGYMERPRIDLSQIKDSSRSILEPIIRSFEFGDETVLSSVLNVFNEHELEPITLKDIIPEAFPSKEFLTQKYPSKDDISDSIRAEKLLTLISPADLGQSLVVRNGSCIAVETSLGTDNMLKSLKDITEPDAKRHCSGILYKAPKLGQNPFLDLPVIGEKTISGIKSIGLNGIVIKHSSVIVLNLKETIKLANQLEVFIWSKK